MLVEPSYWLLQRYRQPRVRVNVAALRGIRVQPALAEELNSLSAAIAAQLPPDAPVLILSSRNDVHIFTPATYYWLTPRRFATRYHQLHPGVTDTPAVQARMLRELDSGPLPVLLREHRFADDALEVEMLKFQQHLDVGCTQLDAWVQRHYRPGRRYGMYELMIPRDMGPDPTSET
jgi:hypothetical protein